MDLVYPWRIYKKKQWKQKIDCIIYYNLQSNWKFASYSISIIDIVTHFSKLCNLVWLQFSTKKKK